MTARVYHADLWGTREGKYDWLNAQDVASTRWKKLAPDRPFYLFVPQDVRLREEYEAGAKFTDIMPVNSVGIVTARDELTIRDTPDDVWKTVRDFASLPEETAREKYDLGKDVEDWQVQLAQRDLKASGFSRDNVVPVLYRPFDERFTYYTGRSRGFICRPRPEVMRHMLAGGNLALITSRMTKGETFKHVQVTRIICEVICMSPKTSNNGFLFPLYLYPHSDKMFEVSPWPAGKGGRRPNLAPEFVAALADRLGLKFIPDGGGGGRNLKFEISNFKSDTSNPKSRSSNLKSEISNLRSRGAFGPEDIFHYAYAVFHSPTYRSRYAEFLKIDFPRLPLTGDKELFARLCALGAELVGLHLLECVPTPAASYPQPGDNVVEKPRYCATGATPTRHRQDGGATSAGRVHINAEQYFDGVPPEVWEFHVGGYQVCEKWLKDRKGRCLSFDDIETYRRTTEALRQTIRLMAEIDAAIPGWPLP